VDITVNLLREYRKYWLKTELQMGNKWQIEKDALFFGADGKLPPPVTTTMWFSRLLKRHNLPHIRFHDLRHTSATLLLLSNQSMKVVSSRLGHSKIGTTLDIYGHVLKNADQEAADVLANMLSNEKGSQQSSGQ
jgi:integrase